MNYLNAGELQFSMLDAITGDLLGDYMVASGKLLRVLSTYEETLPAEVQEHYRAACEAAEKYRDRAIYLDTEAIGAGARSFIEGGPFQEHDDDGVDQTNRADSTRVKQLMRRILELETELNNLLWEAREQVCELPSEELAKKAANMLNDPRLGQLWEELGSLCDETARLADSAENGHAGWCYLNGLALRIRRCFAEAEVRFREFLEVHPMILDAWLELTWCLACQDKLQEAEETARCAVHIKPSSARAWGNMASVLIRQGRKDAARDALDTALLYDPEDEKNKYIGEHFEEYFEKYKLN